MARGKVYSILWKQSASGGPAVKRELDGIRDSSAGATRAHGALRQATSAVNRTFAAQASAARQSIEALRENAARTSALVASERQRLKAMQETLAAERQGPAAAQALARAREVENAVARAGVDAQSSLGKAYVAIIQQQQRAASQIDEVRKARERESRVAEKAARDREHEAKKATGGGITVSGLYNAAAAAGVFFGLKRAMRAMFQEAATGESVLRALEQTIRATGGSAGRTAQQLTEQASKLQDATAVADDLIGAAQGIVLRFKNIRSDTFDRTIEAVLDLSRATGDLEGSAQLLGKSLNDPEKALARLQRSGVDFTDAQEKQLAAMIRTNDMVGAQGVILDAVAGSVGGLAAAYRSTLQGTLDALHNQIADLAEEAGNQAAPALKALVAELKTGSPEALNLARSVGQAAAAIIRAISWVLSTYNEARAVIAGFYAFFLQTAGYAIDGVVSLWQKGANGILGFVGAIAEGISKLGGPRDALYRKAAEQIAAIQATVNEAATGVRQFAQEMVSMGENFQDVAAEQLSLADSIAGAADAAASAVNNLVAPMDDMGEASEKELEKIRETIRELRALARQRTEEAVAVREGTAALQALAVRQAVEGALRSASIKLTEKEIAVLVAGGRVRKEYANELAAAARLLAIKEQALERAEEAEERHTQALRQGQEAARKVRDVVATFVRDASALNQSLLELGVSITDLRLEMLGLTKESGAYARKAAEVIDLEQAWSAGNRQLAISLRSNTTPALEQARTIFADWQQTMRGQIDVTLRGVDALALYNKEVALLKQAGDIAQKAVQPIAGEGIEEFARRWLAVRRDAEELLRELAKAEINADLFRPWRDAMVSVRDLAVDTFVNIARTGEISWKDLWGSFLDIAAQALREFLKRWLTTMAAARAASAGLNQGGMSGIGPVASGSQYASLLSGGGGGGFSVSGLASSLAGSQAFWGGVYAIVIYAAIEALKHGPLETYSAIGSQQGQALVTEFRRSYQGQLDQFKSIGDAVADGINAALQELRGSIARLPSLAIGTYGNQFKVWVNGVRHIFSDVESAISFAISQALAQGEFTGLSPEVQAALQHSAARSLEELQADIATAVQLETINMGDVGRTIREKITEFWRLFTEAARLGIPRTDLLSNFRQSWQKWRDELLGIVRPPAEQQQQDIREFNEALRREKAYAEAQLRAAEGQLLAAQIQLTAAQKMLEESGRGDPEVGRLLSDARRLFDLWTANVNDLRQILSSFPSQITPEEAARARPRGRGGRGADRAAEIESFRKSLEEIFLSVVPAAQRELISLNDRIRELWEEGRRLNISTEDLARAEAILREQYGRSLRDAIAPFLTTLPEILARYQADLRTIAEVRGVPRGERIRAGGPTDWQLNQAEANVRARAAEEVRAAALAMAGLGDGIAGVHAQAEALRVTVLGLGLSAEETARQISGINLSEALAIQSGQLDVLGRLFGYLRDSARHASQVAEYERQRVEFEFAILRAQLEAWNLWEQYAGVWSDAQEAAIAAAGRASSSGKTPQELAAENLARRQEEAVQEFARAVEQWAASTQRLIDAQNKLRLGELSGLSARDQLQEARRQLDTVLAAARGGDIEAREAFPEAVEAYLRELQAFSPSSQLYAEQFRELDAIFTELIGQRFRFGNVTATGQFGLNPSTPTQAGAAGAAAQQQTTFSAAGAANVERLLLASGQEDVRHNRAIEGEVKQLREKMDELTAKDERQTKALEMLSEQIRALLERVA